MKGCWCNSKGFSHLHQSQLWWGPLQGEWWETLLWKMELVVLLYHWHYDPASKCAYWNGFPLSWDAGNEIMSLSRNKMGLVKPAALTGRHKCFWFKTNKRNHQPPSKKQQQKPRTKPKQIHKKTTNRTRKPNQNTPPSHQLIVTTMLLLWGRFWHSVSAALVSVAGFYTHRLTM